MCDNTDMNIQRLSNKVQARNLANATRNALLPKLRAFVLEFAGQKVQLATSTNFTAKFRKAVEALALPNNTHGAADNN